MKMCAQTENWEIQFEEKIKKLERKKQLNIRFSEVSAVSAGH